MLLHLAVHHQQESCRHTGSTSIAISNTFGAKHHVGLAPACSRRVWLTCARRFSLGARLLSSTGPLLLLPAAPSLPGLQGPAEAAAAFLLFFPEGAAAAEGVAAVGRAGARLWRIPLCFCLSVLCVHTPLISHVTAEQAPEAVLGKSLAWWKLQQCKDWCRHDRCCYYCIRMVQVSNAHAKQCLAVMQMAPLSHASAVMQDSTVQQSSGLQQDSMYRRAEAAHRFISHSGHSHTASSCSAPTVSCSSSHLSAH